MAEQQWSGPYVDLAVGESGGERRRDSANEYAEDVLQLGRPGPPSLGVPGQDRPRVSFQVSQQTWDRAEERATEQGRSVSELAREVFERYVRSADDSG